MFSLEIEKASSWSNHCILSESLDKRDVLINRFDRCGITFLLLNLSSGRSEKWGRGVSLMSSFVIPLFINNFKCSFRSKKTRNKKVLLRERKRHTARRVASTPYVVLTGYPPHQSGYPPGQGTPWPRYPPGQGTPPGYPPARVSPWPGYPQQGTPRLDLVGYPSPGCPMAFWVMLQSIMGYGYPPRCEQTENITFPHPSDAGGNYDKYHMERKKFIRLKHERILLDMIQSGNSKKLK